MLKTCFFLFLVVVAGSSHGELRKECLLMSPYEILIDEEQVAFNGEKLSPIIFRGNTIVQNGNYLNLDASSAEKAFEFSMRVRRMVALLAELAEQNAVIAIVVTRKISKSVLQLEGQEHQNLVQPVQELVSVVRAHISNNRLDPAVLELEFGALIASVLEAALDLAVSETSTKMWSIFSDDPNDDSLERRITDFEFWLANDLGKEMNEIEAKADILCLELQHLASLDRDLKAARGYPAQGLIHKVESGKIRSLDYFSKLLEPGGVGEIF